VGAGYGKITATENIVVPKGVFDGVTLKVKQKGNETLKGSVGDILLKVLVEPSQYYTKDGDNIIVKKKVTMTQAILGDQIKVRTVQGGVKDVTLPPGGESQTIILKGMGIQKLGTEEIGDLHVHLVY
jgi:molecular chaperone DnaJ